MTEIDPELVRDLLPPMGLYQQLDEIARMADAGDDNAAKFIQWFAGPEDELQVKVGEKYDFEDVSRAVALFVAARSASHEFDTKGPSPMSVRVIVSFP